MKRGLGLVAFLLGLALLISVAGVVLLYILVSPRARVAERSTLVLRPGG